MNVVVSGHHFVLRETWARWERFAEKYPDSEVTLLAPSTWETTHFGSRTKFEVEEYQNGNFQVIPIKKWNFKRQFYLSLDMHLRTLKPDIFHIVNERYGWWPYQALLYKYLWARRCITVGYSYTNIDYRFTKIRHRLKEGIFIKGMDAIICGNSEAKQILRKHGYHKPVILQQETGVDERVWMPGKSEEVKERYSLQGIAIGYFGRLMPEKGLDTLFDAVAQLSDDNWTLLIVGDGPMRQDLENILIKRGKRENARFLGYTPRADLPPIMSALDMLILPSRTVEKKGFKEQFGLVLAEAMMSGVAVIGSDSGAIPEVIGDAGLIFPEGDVNELKRFIERLLEDGDYRRVLAEKGLKRAQEYYSADSLAEQSHDFFMELLNSKGTQCGF